MFVYFQFHIFSLTNYNKILVKLVKKENTIVAYIKIVNTNKLINKCAFIMDKYRPTYK